MSETKEKILLTALHLFARDGYEAVSVSAIAGELGMTKGALYRHYRSKRDIFDSIVERMYRVDAERSREFQMPEQTFDVAPEAYRSATVTGIVGFTLDRFVFWTEDPFAADFRKMLTLEQYRNPEMAQLYRGCLTEGPVAYMQDLFRELMGKGILKRSDPKQLAVSYYAPFYLLLGTYRDTEDRTAIELLKQHVDRFFREHLLHDFA